MEDQGTKKKFKQRRRLHLAWALEELWAWGLLSAMVLQFIAAAALKDGLDNDKIQQFARIANKGTIPGNARRDLLRKSTLNKEKFPSTQLDLPVQAKTDKFINNTHVPAKTAFIQKHTVYLPHLMFHWLLANAEDFVKSILSFQPKWFWENCHPDDPRLKDHPVKSKPDYRLKAYPLVLHGDGAKYTDVGDNLLTLSWGFLGSTDETEDVWKSCFVIISIVKNCLCTTAEHGVSTLDKIFDAICASFNVCLLAILPQKAPDGSPFETNSYEAYLKESKATFADNKGYGFLYAVIGDWEFLALECKVPHYGCIFFCWFCNAQQNDSDMNYKNWSTNAPHKETIIPDYRYTMPSRRLEPIEGTNRYMFVWEWMHSWHYGPVQHLCGSCMCESLDYFPGTIEMKHAALWKAIQRIYKDQETKNRCNRITLTMYNVKTDDFAQLRHMSAATCKEMPKVLSQLVAENTRHTDHEKHLLCALEAAANMEDIIQNHGIFIGLPMAEQLEKSYEAFCLHFNKLTVNSIARNQLLYNQCPKMHGVGHTCQFAKFCNPRILWAYRWESLMSKMITCASFCSRGTPTHQVGNKIMTNYKHIVLLMIQRWRENA